MTTDVRRREVVYNELPLQPALPRPVLPSGDGAQPERQQRLWPANREIHREWSDRLERWQLFDVRIRQGKADKHHRL